MTKRWCVVIMSVALLSAVAPARAQDAAEADQMFKSLDTNGDGKITSADITDNNRAMIERIFSMSGKQPDGEVTRQDFQRVFDMHRGGGNAPQPATPTTPSTPPAPSTPAPESPQPSTGGTPVTISDALLRLADTDGDGKISRAEWNRLAQAWPRLDTNRDGVLDATELAAAESILRATPTPTPTPGSARTTTPPAPGSARTTTPATANTRGNRLDGSWRGQIMNPQGSAEMEIELTIRGNRIDAREIGTNHTPGGLGWGNFTMTPSSADGRRGNMDANAVEGGLHGRSYQGIYEIDGDTLRWCVGGRPNLRPTAMATRDGSYLVVLRRAAARPSPAPIGTSE